MVPAMRKWFNENFTEEKYKDAQRLGDNQYVCTSLMESFGESRKKY